MHEWRGSDFAFKREERERVKLERDQPICMAN